MRVVALAALALASACHPPAGSTLVPGSPLEDALDAVDEAWSEAIGPIPEACRDRRDRVRVLVTDDAHTFVRNAHHCPPAQDYDCDTTRVSAAASRYKDGRERGLLVVSWHTVDVRAAVVHEYLHELQRCIRHGEWHWDQWCHGAYEVATYEEHRCADGPWAGDVWGRDGVYRRALEVLRR